MIAIVGRGCVLPGAPDPAALWQAVAAGRDLVSQAPAGRWGLDPERVLPSRVGGDKPSLRDRAWHDRGGYIHETVHEPAVDGLDPLFHWLLRAARQALEEAGVEAAEVGVSGTAGTRTGAVFGNLMFPTLGASRFAEAVWRGKDTSHLDARDRCSAGLPAHLLADILGLGAGAFCLDAACASSLYALEFACRRLREGSADIMLAGAVSCADDLFLHIGFTALEALSPSGQSRPFHRDADGLLPAEGAACVVLQRLDDAIAAGRPILGVLRGIGLSNDGRGRGLLAPSTEGQQRALHAAYATAGRTPAHVSLIECHATGTRVGDATELQSLAAVYTRDGAGSAVEPIALGSLKSNLGHLITVAGMAGLLKVLGALEHGTRPPSLHAADDPTPAFDGTPFRLLSEPEPWPEQDAPRLAALSAFGFGGNNAHLLVEEYRPKAPPRLKAPLRPPDQVPVTATSEPVAIVALEVLAGEGRGVDDFVAALEAPPPDRLPARQQVELELAGLRFPPRDLEQALPQQLLLLQAARRLLDGNAEASGGGLELPPDRTGVLVGLQVDAEIARYGLRWRHGHEHPGCLAAVPELHAAGVVGTMPNIPANRLNQQFDLRGGSAVVAAEELSGIEALRVAAQALRHGELDAAVVGAVDVVAGEPVQQAVLEALLPAGSPRRGGDAAVVLVLRRLADARRLGEPVLAVLGSHEVGEPAIEHDIARFTLGTDSDTDAVTARFGHAHAASGLLQVAAAVQALHRRRCFGGAAGHSKVGRPWLLPSGARSRIAEVRVEALTGASGTVQLQAADGAPPFGATPFGATPFGATPSGVRPGLVLYSGTDRGEVLQRLQRDQRAAVTTNDPARLVLVADSEDDLATRRSQAASWLQQGTGRLPAGMAFRERPLVGQGSLVGQDDSDAGQLAFVYTGGGAAYPEMGAGLLATFPSLLDRLEARSRELPRAAAWVYGQTEEAPDPLQLLWGTSFLCQLHTELSRGLLGLQPDAVLGYSSGETNSLVATGVWPDVDQLVLASEAGELLSRDLCGECRVLTPVKDGEQTIHWMNYQLSAPVDAVRAAVETEVAQGGLVHLTLISSPEDAVLGGDQAACRRVLDALDVTGVPLDYRMVVHCPQVRDVADAWLDLHRLPTRPEALERDGAAVRLYSGAKAAPYRPDRESAAQAILAQAADTLDFRRVVRRAYADGVRVFLEHGPRGLCSSWIRKTLLADGVPEESFLAVPLDRRRLSARASTSDGARGLRATVEAAAQLLAAGVAGDYSALTLSALALSALTLPTAAALPQHRLTFPAHWPPVASLSNQEQEAPMSSVSAAEANVQIMAPAPVLPPVLGEVPAEYRGAALPQKVLPREVLPQEVPAEYRPQPNPTSPHLDELQHLQASIARAQQEFLAQQSQLHERFLAVQQGMLAGMLGAEAERMPHAEPPIRPGHSQWGAPAQSSDPHAGKEIPPWVPSGVAASDPQTTPPSIGPVDPAVPPPRGPAFDRAQLLELASGRISTVFGDLFRRQDAYPRQVRLPEPPFLLVDRITGIDAEAGSMGTGTIWTETDVREDSWYLHDGRMPAGLMIEAGQADLTLISWLGVDFLNQGERVYRLLGCDLTYHGRPPAVGETLAYDIHIDGHAKQGDVRLFFFHYDCRIDGARRLSVRGGQAGFFTDQELADSGGLLWDASTDTPSPETYTPPVPCVEAALIPRQLSKDQLLDFARGRGAAALGSAYARAATHVRTPSIPAPPLLLLDRVTDLDIQGGPWGRGYLRAELDIGDGDSWIFDGHFKNDPCMPGTVMFEGCLNTMALVLAALGYTLDRDGWRFEPVPEVAYPLRCRGQVIPTSKQLVYEVFVHQVDIVDPSNPQCGPTLWADLLCTVDGLKAFHGRRVGLRLVPDQPLSSAPERLHTAVALPPTARPPVTVRPGQSDAHTFDGAALLASAWGAPSAAFGAPFIRFDAADRRTPRLPGPPYHCLSRVVEIDGEQGTLDPSAGLRQRYAATLDYDLPHARAERLFPEDDFVPEGGTGALPFALLMETGLQPCGWLASYVGSTLHSSENLHFRNLDGTGTVHAELRAGEDPRSTQGTVSTRTELVGVARSGSSIIERFDVRMERDTANGKEPVFTMQTAFGFFPAAALADQAGLPTTDAQRARLELPADADGGDPAFASLDLTREPEGWFVNDEGGGAGLARGRLRLLDRVTGWWPQGGDAGLGRARAEFDVDPTAWFFAAHFYQDPVQPGSLGLEALLQLLRFAVVAGTGGKGLEERRFQAPAIGREFSWKYRGQVLPHNRKVVVEVEVTEVAEDGTLTVADASLWVDGKRIYEASGLAVRWVPVRS